MQSFTTSFYCCWIETGINVSFHHDIEGYWIIRYNFLKSWAFMSWFCPAYVWLWMSYTQEDKAYQVNVTQKMMRDALWQQINRCSGVPGLCLQLPAEGRRISYEWANPIDWQLDWTVSLTFKQSTNDHTNDTDFDWRNKSCFVMWYFL